MEAILFLVDAILVAGLGLWMTVAVADNWRHPKMNEEAVAMVVRFDLMAEQFPDDYRLVAHRRIESPALIGFLFRAMRLAESIAAIALLTSALLLILASSGAVSGTLATGVAVPSAAFFTMIWGGFVIGGNYFAYWYCHQWAQSNHFMLMYWGFFVLIVLLL
jgi:predicted small integral membrane protein